MLLKYFYDDRLAQASYMIGCQACGEALVIDASRDIAPYIQTAESEGLSITHVSETHIHADYVSGSRELAAKSGARLYLSDMGNTDWKYDFPEVRSGAATLLHDGDAFMVGNIRIEIVHTPGHTPEHIVFMITDTAGADRPMGVFTGDFLFVGGVGRPDLLEEAAGIAGTAEPGARQQFHNLQRFRTMPDYLQVWPGHGAGSACGKGLGAIPSSTLGYEKLFNTAFQCDDEETFVTWLLKDQPEPPRYFARMKRVNRIGPALLSELAEPGHLAGMDGTGVSGLIDSGALVIDTRDTPQFARAHIPGTLNIPATSSGFNTYAGWYVDFDQQTYLIATPETAPRLIRDLRAVGIDNLPGYFTPDIVNGFDESLTQIDPQEAAEKMGNAGFILDVRGATEHVEERIPGVRHIPMGYLPRHLGELPKDELIIIQCGSGVRSEVAASLLLKYGFTNVANLSGGIDAWRAAGLPTQRG